MSQNTPFPFSNWVKVFPIFLITTYLDQLSFDCSSNSGLHLSKLHLRLSWFDNRNIWFHIHQYAWLICMVNAGNGAQVTRSISHITSHNITKKNYQYFLGCNFSWHEKVTLRKSNFFTLRTQKILKLSPVYQPLSSLFGGSCVVVNLHSIKTYATYAA